MLHLGLSSCLMVLQLGLALLVKDLIVQLCQSLRLPLQTSRRQTLPPRHLLNLTVVRHSLVCDVLL